MITILRPTDAIELPTAAVFEDLFTQHIGGAFALHRPSLSNWLAAAIGVPTMPLSIEKIAHNFEAATSKYDFLCPTYEATPLVPLLTMLRNISGASVRLLFIAHAPGAYILELALLLPLLRPGDRIIAPTASAKNALLFLASEFEPYVSVAAHPMEPLPGGPAAREPRLVSISRVFDEKLTHRQIQGLHVLRQVRHRKVTMEIAGPTGSAADPFRPYERSLHEKIARFGLQDSVRLVGTIEGRAAKANFLRSARGLVNLSVTVEESFGKAPVEALGIGVPVLGTRWGGLVDTIGTCGELIQPIEVGEIVPRFDVTADAVADAMERILDCPSNADDCREQAALFAPEVSVSQYRSALEGSLAEAIPSGQISPPDRDAPLAYGTGLLGYLAPLLQVGWWEVFDAYPMRRGGVKSVWCSATAAHREIVGALRSVVLAAAQLPLQRFMAGVRSDVALTETIRNRARPELTPSEFQQRIARGISAGPSSGGLTCLLLTLNRQPSLIGPDPSQLSLLGYSPPMVTHTQIALSAHTGETGTALAAAIRALRTSAAGEFDSIRIAQLAQVARRAGRPTLALGAIEAWLARFPDSGDSGFIWLEYCACAANSGPSFAATARRALMRAQALLGEIPIVVETKAWLGTLSTQTSA